VKAFAVVAWQIRLRFSRRGRLAFFKGEGEDEGSLSAFTVAVSNPSPESSP